MSSFLDGCYALTAASLAGSATATTSASAETPAETPVETPLLKYVPISVSDTCISITKHLSKIKMSNLFHFSIDSITVFHLADIVIACDNLARRPNGHSIEKKWHSAFFLRWKAVHHKFAQILTELEYRLMNECNGPERPHIAPVNGAVEAKTT